jgi:hypothetical protein
MLEYFLDSSLGPPMAIETFSFGFFCIISWRLCCTGLQDGKAKDEIFQHQFSTLLEVVQYLEYNCIYPPSASVSRPLYTQAMNWMCDIIQASKCVDDVSVQRWARWVNMLNKKFAVIRPVCSHPFYVANDNFVVRDGISRICKKNKNIVSSCFTQRQIFLLREMLWSVKREDVALGGNFICFDSFLLFKMVKIKNPKCNWHSTYLL